MMPSIDAVVTGAGGFIGGHLVATFWQRATPSARSTTSPRRVVPASYDAVNRACDVSLIDAARSRGRWRARSTISPPTWVAWGSSRTTRPLCMLSVLINTHLLMAAQDAGVERFFYRLVGMCLRRRQADGCRRRRASKEEDAYPAMPEDGYGWEKLFSERMCRHFREDFGVETRVARYHNVYGPHGTWRGGREKAPAAICRKVATPMLTGATRSRSGATEADPQLHVHRRLHRGDPMLITRAISSTRSISGRARW